MWQHFKLCKSRNLHFLIFVDAFLKKNNSQFKEFEDLSAGKFHPRRFVQGDM